jgi:hypothetical protein
VIVKWLSVDNAEFGKKFVHPYGLIIVRKGDLIKPFRRLGKKAFAIQGIRLGRRTRSRRLV